MGPDDQGPEGLLVAWAGVCYVASSSPVKPIIRPRPPLRPSPNPSLDQKCQGQSISQAGLTWDNESLPTYRALYGWYLIRFTITKRRIVSHSTVSTPLTALSSATPSDHCRIFVAFTKLPDAVVKGS